MGYDSAKYLRNRDAVLAYNRRWRESRKELLAAKRRVKYAADPVRGRAINKASREKNKVVIKEREKARSPEKRAYYLSHREIIYAQRALRRPEINASIGRWKKKNPDKVHAYAVKRLALKPGATAVGQRSSKFISRLRVLQRDSCALCASSISNACHADHIIPLSRGGTHEFTNLQLLCPPCNLSKAAKDPIAYAQSIGKLL